MLRGFAAISYWADDLEAGENWYTDLLGIEPYFVRPEEARRPMSNSASVTTRTSWAASTGGCARLRGERSRRGGHVLARRRRAATFERLLSMGAKEYRPIAQRGEAGWITASVVDPFGNIHGIIYSPTTWRPSPPSRFVSVECCCVRCPTKLARWPSSVGCYVPMASFLFSSFGSEKATVADNIRFGRPEATRQEVEVAARAIGAEPVILELPDGYDTEVGERGALLSAGERQLVAFARAWLADPALLILDEATSSLDVATETRVTEAMRRLRQGRTTIVIAHRLSTVIEADQIAVIEDGRVVEAGPPEELLTRGGQFADLYGRWLAGAA
jgi:ABC transporter